ncbi:siderophore-interacting protein [Corynebacterium pseudokroppenstedtii]|uniref:siderophore-interacting protein n=1 Tax=Corynebacterium pseudokroppenstedtii TaxID=2804917 RepID=UPI00351D83DB
MSLAFLIHEPAGPAAIWAQQAQIGDELTIQRMGGEATPQRAESRRLSLSRRRGFLARNFFYCFIAPR